jgi:SNF2 family DNA or RNA helicase
MKIDLPDRNERIEHITLSRHDQELYDFFKGKTEKITSGASKKQKSYLDKSEDNILALITILRRICNHGEDLLPEWASKSWRDRSNNAVDWSAIQCRREICSRCGEDMDMPDLLDSPSSRTSHRYYLCDSCAQIEDINNSEEESLRMPVETSVIIRHPTLPTHPAIPCHPSAKVEALLKNLLIEQKTGNARTQSKR